MFQSRRCSPKSARLGLLAAVSLLCVHPAVAVTIVIEPADRGLGGIGGSGLSASQLALLESAARRWEQYLPAYQPGITLSGPRVRAFSEPVDGSGNSFAEAGPDSDTLAFQRGRFFSTSGEIRFDSADIDLLQAEGTLTVVMLHELAHVLGFGTLWSLNGLYTEGTGQYFGGAAATAWADEFQSGSFTVPVELGGGPSTRDAHWDEADGGLGPTGHTDDHGRDIGNELMSGWIGPDPQASFISRTTLASFEDLGFVVAIPEPGTLALLGGAALLSLCRWRAR